MWCPVERSLSKCCHLWKLWMTISAIAGNVSLSRFLKQQPHSTMLISWELMVFKKDTENKWKLTQAAGEYGFTSKFWTFWHHYWGNSLIQPTVELCSWTGFGFCPLYPELDNFAQVCLKHGAILCESILIINRVLYVRDKWTCSDCNSQYKLS